MERFARFLYHPAVPLGKNRTFITGCKAHRTLAREAATEGTVLLKNDGTLPLQQGAKVCLFGRGAGNFIFGGGGSGWVNAEKLTTLAEALEEAAANREISFFSPLVDFYKDAYQKEYEIYKDSSDLRARKWRAGWDQATPVLPEALYQQAKAFGDTAIFCVARYSTEGSVHGDRLCTKGNFYLDDDEIALLDRLTKDFSKVVVVLNVCGPVSTVEFRDNDRIGAVLYPLYGGAAAGNVIVDILLGKQYPSGHLQDTLAVSIDDYPSTKGYHDDLTHIDYTEDIFVGYRYFETFCPEKVVYPFGFGLGYTTFSIAMTKASLEKNTVTLALQVKNTGNFPGKEVVQAYLTAPQGKLGKAKKVLCAFAKTKELKPGEAADVKLHFDIREFGSFDDLGKIVKSAFILEQGEYTVTVGNSVRDCAAVFTFTLGNDIICRRCHSYMAPRELPERLTADGTMEKLPAAVPVKHPPKRYKLKQSAPEVPLSFTDALQNDQLDAFIAGMSDHDLAYLLHGHPNMNPADTNSIGLYMKEKRDIAKVPMVPTADGPAGLRAIPNSGISPTFFPCANVVAQSWNLSLAQRIGIAGAKEVKENNAGIWLAPALNIHRSPLCGRNFEYYSEDPLISGMFAAANVKGVQSQNIAATVKHFCCNNKEMGRLTSDSRVSERALREIYLRGFEIVVKKAKPWALMTAYNMINGEHATTNWESINGILRGEWKYDGLVMTDWWTFSLIEDELAAGSDVKMPEMITGTYPNHFPGAPEPFDLGQKLTDGDLDRGMVLNAVRRILKFMDHFE